MFMRKNVAADREFMREHFKAMCCYYRVRVDELLEIIKTEDNEAVCEKLYELMREYSKLEHSMWQCYWEYRD